MDVGDPSNLSRVIEIFDRDLSGIRSMLTAVSVTDAETEATMKNVYAEAGYILDPHGAVGYKALADHIEAYPDRRGIFLATAHPVKFECTERILGAHGSVPESIRELSDRTKSAREIEADYGEVREIILSLI